MVLGVLEKNQLVKTEFLTGCTVAFVLTEARICFTGDGLPDAAGGAGAPALHAKSWPQANSLHVRRNPAAAGNEVAFIATVYGPNVLMY